MCGKMIDNFAACLDLIWTNYVRVFCFVIKVHNCDIKYLTLHRLQLAIISCISFYPRRARSAIGVDTVLTLDVCLYVCMYVSALERKCLIGMT